MRYEVHLKEFEGPLDLLLHLISKAKIDIKDIFVSHITEQYLEYMEGIGELDMDQASEFLAMAALLVEIKSRAMLPRPPKVEEDEESPEEELIRRLTEYQQFKQSAAEMQEMEKTARLSYYKLPEEVYFSHKEFKLEGLTLEGLLRAFQEVLRRKPEVSAPPSFRPIHRDHYTIEECIFRIQARVSGGPMDFWELFDESPDKEEIVTIFLALLELIKLRRVRVKQENTFAGIELSPGPALRGKTERNAIL